MNRLGLLTPSSLEEQQRQAYDAYDKELQSRPANYVHNKDEEGCLIGPAGALIHNPEVLKNCAGLRKALSKSVKKSGLPQQAVEVASLVVAARTRATYEIYAHSRSSGFSQEMLDDIRNGECPPELDEEGQIAFEVATALGKPGSLSEAKWQKAVEAFGVNGAAALVECIGFYTFLSTISNGFDIQLPAAYVSESSSANSARSSARSSFSSEFGDSLI